MDRKLLDILCCPASKQPLDLLNAAELAAINAVVGQSGLPRNDGSLQSEPLKEGLITRDHKLVYRIDDGIPVLLVDESMATALVTDFPR